MKSLVIAVFVKDDLIQKQIDNLLEVNNINDYNIIFYQDTPKDNPNKKYHTLYYQDKFENVKNIIEKNIYKFKNATFKRTNINLQPYGVCKISLDLAFENNDFCIFMEDDVFLSKNALSWFNYIYDNNFLAWEKYKFVTGESIYYDTMSMELFPSEDKLIEIKKTIEENKYQKYYYEINHFLTSSIFATTKAIWNTEIRDLRGSINGADALNNAIQKNKWKSIFPVVPFAKDIGMLHDDGWSVAWHTKKGVREIKNTYLLADSFETVNNYEKIPDNFDLSVFKPKID